MRCEDFLSTNQRTNQTLDLHQQYNREAPYNATNEQLFP